MTKTPTQDQFTAYQAMYDHFNRELFGGKLCPVVLNFSRKANSLGFFAPERWADSVSAKANRTHEISLNPSWLALRKPIETASTLVHEMVHCWQQESGKPGARGYHNAEWAARMKEVGLYPSSTGAPGGKETGFRMTHYIVEGGAFAKAFRKLPKQALPWLAFDGTDAKKPRTSSKVKHTCPECDANAWGKATLNLVCGDCECPMTKEAE